MQREVIFEKAKDVTIISQSAFFSDIFINRVFLPHYWIFSSFGGYKKMVAAYLVHYVSLHLKKIHFI